jgi:hypothetical protein
MRSDTSIRHACVLFLSVGFRFALFVMDWDVVFNSFAVDDPDRNQIVARP